MGVALRKSVIIGNWKMNKNFDDAKALVNDILSKELDENVEKVICVPFLYVTEIKKMLSNSSVELGVQNMYFEENGAFTGEVSPTMLKSCGVDYVIIGHSERRTIFNESDEMVNKKVKSALNHDLTPILCCGETLTEREEKKEKQIIQNQIKNALLEITKEEISKVIIAYEPIWAIGTGLTASSEDAEDMVKYIREILSDLYGEVSEKVRIQYGGSVKPNNVKELMSKENIDGALVGGACLDAESFSKLVNYNL